MWQTDGLWLCFYCDPLNDTAWKCPVSHVRPESEFRFGHIQVNSFSDDEDSDSEYDEGDEPSHGATHGRLLREHARSVATTRAWAHVLSSAADRDDLTKDAIALVDAMGGDSYWLAKDATPRCSLELLAKSIFDFHTAGLAPVDGAIVQGAEWWVQVRASDSRMPSVRLHWDGDEGTKRATGEHIPPWLATVTYTGGQGAPTIVFPVAADALGRALPPKLKLGSFISYPKAGKHLAFDGRLLHGALHEMSLPTEEPFVRVSVLVNMWLGHRPLGVMRLPKQMSQKLSMVDAADFASALPVEIKEHQAHAQSRTVDEAGQQVATTSGPPQDDRSRLLTVRFLPQKKLTQQFPDWHTWQIGFPFFHPPVHVDHLPVPCVGSIPPSLLHVSDMNTSF